MLETQPHICDMLYVKKAPNVTGITTAVLIKKSVFEYTVIAICIR